MRNAKHIRLAKGLTLMEVARATELDPSRINRLENAKVSRKDYDLLKPLAEFYGCQIDDLFLEVEHVVEATP